MSCNCCPPFIFPPMVQDCCGNIRKLQSNESLWVPSVYVNGDLGQILIPLQNDLTLNVATTGSDVNGDGTASKPFATLNHAVSYAQRFIPSGFDITIQFADGQYEFTESYIPASPVNNAITILGNTDVINVSASLSNFDTAYSPDANFPELQYFDMDVDTTGTTVEVGEIIRITGTSGGTNPNACIGAHEVIAYDSVNDLATVRVWHTLGVSALPSGSITGNAQVFRVVFRYNLSSGHAIHINSYVDSGLFQNVAIVANDHNEYDNSSGVRTENKGNFRCNNICIVGFQHGIFAQLLGTASGTTVTISKIRTQGAQAFASDIFVISSYFTGCAGRAGISQTGAILNMQGANIVGSGGPSAVEAQVHSTLSVVGGTLSYGSGSTTGAFAQLSGVIDARSATFTGYTANTATATQGFVHT